MARRGTHARGHPAAKRSLRTFRGAPKGVRNSSMTHVNRRRFLQLAGATAATSALSTSIARAAEIPAYHGTGTLRDIEHIVVLMQENRSFDHYFGVLRGVRGFGDPRPVTLPSGKA